MKEKEIVRLQAKVEKLQTAEERLKLQLDKVENKKSAVKKTTEKKTVKKNTTAKKDN